MKVSLNTIRQFIDFELPPVDELVKRINEQLGGVEKVIDLGAKYKDAKIVRVVECEKHTNADKLSVCKIDAGTGELVQVVCGASNVKADMWAVWLPPESIVPSTFDDAEPFMLGARELRGEMSSGMLASAKELALGDDHDGIVELANDDLDDSSTLSPGASFAETFGLDDTIIDIENKMFTHRPDLFGQLGVAREVSAILGHAFTSPPWYLDTPIFKKAEDLELSIFNDAEKSVPRFMAVAIKDVAVTKSPLWLQCRLVAMGGKPINNIVDVTNYIMLMTAQPTHAYDYDKLAGSTLGARMAHAGEPITLLNGKTYTLTSDDIVIVDGKGPVGLAGIMGGSNTEVSAETKNIVLECANFDMYAVRKSSMRHGLFTDALTRFNKGQSALQNDRVLAQLMEMTGGIQASEVFDIHSLEQLQDIPEDMEQHRFILENPTVQFTSTYFVNDRLGLHLPAEDIARLLENVEMKVNEDDLARGALNEYADASDMISVAPPFWRTDIVDPEDIVEEVGRLYGFDKLPRELPNRSTKPAEKNVKRELEQTIRSQLSRLGANEVLTYSFVHEKILKNAGQNPDHAYRLGNALSPDLQFYRLSITPSLLDKVHANSKAGYDEFALFEIGKAHSKQAELVDTVPAEQLRVGFVYAAKTARTGAPYYAAKRYLDELALVLGLELSYKMLPDDTEITTAQVFDHVRRARVVDVKSGQPVALIGEYSANAQRTFKLPSYAAGFELLTEGLLLACADQQGRHYQPLSRFPATHRDMTVRVDGNVAFDEVQTIVQQTIDEQPRVRTEVEAQGVYQAQNSPTKNVTFRLRIGADDKTLTSDDVTGLIEKISTALNQKLDATIV